METALRPAPGVGSRSSEIKSKTHDRDQQHQQNGRSMVLYNFAFPFHPFTSALLYNRPYEKAILFAGCNSLVRRIGEDMRLSHRLTSPGGAAGVCRKKGTSLKTPPPPCMFAGPMRRMRQSGMEFARKILKLLRDLVYNSAEVILCQFWNS
ncbi:MAG: hypothetical protein ACLVJ6_12995 [Merdibacter sp.]